MTKKLKVIVVDDSAVDRMLSVHILDADPRLQVVRTAGSGAEAIALNAALEVDVMVMDVTMPDMDGLETTSRIMQTKPVPIVICTGLQSTDPTISFRAIEAGALALVGKPRGVGHADFRTIARALADTVVLMSEVKLVRRWSRLRQASRVVRPAARAITSRPHAAVRFVAIGASTGGPPVLHTILSRLGPDFPVPTLIVQHISPGFLIGMAAWLQSATGVPIRIARHGETPLPGHAYLAPDGCHMGLNAAGVIVLSEEEPIDRLRPAVAHLFASIANTPFAANVVGVLLTGMGSDGAEELTRLKSLGATTIAQDEESSVVHGMPGAAINLGGATLVQGPETIAATLRELGQRPPAR